MIGDLFCSYTNNYYDVLFLFDVYNFTKYPYNFTPTIVTNYLFYYVSVQLILDTRDCWIFNNFTIVNFLNKI